MQVALLVFAVVAGSEAASPAKPTVPSTMSSEANELTVLKELTRPASEDERAAACAWFRSELERQRYLRANLRKHDYTETEAANLESAILKVEGALQMLISQAGCV